MCVLLIVRYLQNSEGRFIWPGFGENVRVLDWICRRVDAGSSDQGAKSTAIGYVPAEGSLNVQGLSTDVDMAELFRLPKDFWQTEVQQVRHYFKEQVNAQLLEFFFSVSCFHSWLRLFPGWQGFA